MTRHYLIIDDDDVCRRILEKQLHQLLGSPVDGEFVPFVIHSARSGSEAVERMISLRPQHYDLVITDFSMPGVNGHETAKLLRVLDRDVPIACLTSDAIDAKFTTSCREAGIFDVWSKPVSGQKIMEILVGSFMPADDTYSSSKIVPERIAPSVAAPVGLF